MISWQVLNSFLYIKLNPGILSKMYSKGKKQELRRIDVEIINFEEREMNPGKQADYANRFIAVLRRKIEIHEEFVI